jgi:hypothetical protein
VRRPVHTQGHSHELVVRSLSCSIGDIKSGGIAFEFDDCNGGSGTCALVHRYRGPGVQCFEGGRWVVSLDELKAIVAEAEAFQAAHASDRARMANQHDDSDETQAQRTSGTSSSRVKRPRSADDKFARLVWNVDAGRDRELTVTLAKDWLVDVELRGRLFEPSRLVLDEVESESLAGALMAAAAHVRAGGGK